MMDAFLARYWTSLDQWRTGTNADRRSRIADPRVDASDLYRLLPGSPAVDAGELLAEVTVDFSGMPRPAGAGVDIGAHEGAARPLTAPTGLRVVK